MRARLTTRSRTSGNFVIGASVIGSPFGEILSMSAEHACRTLPFTSIVHDPQTSSRQLASHTTGATALPLASTGFFWISINALMTFICGCQSMSNSSQRLVLVLPGASCLRTLSRIFRFSAIVEIIMGKSGPADKTRQVRSTRLAVLVAMVARVVLLLLGALLCVQG